MQTETEHTQQPSTIEGKKGKNVRKEVLSWIVTLGVTVLVALIIRTFVFTLAIVDGPSMLETLQDKDVMFVWRLGYLFNEPKRGDVTLCRYPDEDDYVTKRVIGLPGESIRMDADTVYINGEPLDEPYLTHYETFGTYDETIIPPGHYFVLGDNRPVSKDSRWVGPLPRDLFMGRCTSILLPLAHLRGL